MPNDADRVKALKVVDLKQILSKAAVQVPAKANKADLVARILESSQALQVFNSLHPSPNGQSEPEPSASEPTPTPASPIDNEVGTPTTNADTPALTESTVSAQAPAAEKEKEDSELERRRQRAARFGIPLVEPAAGRTTKEKRNKTIAPAASDVPEKLNARAERFGAQVTNKTNNDKKRPAARDNVDPEEEERRKKRAERFGGTKSAVRYHT
ncbi:hypothetical protein BDN72DRAFT_757785 [Pluteus cervinus]|uniref:Uncharacterized protein n=1 Tax=Pluteus cervinus TaxID=181527 RepID=A0ACD3BCA7_9AGAR|nr:hypothetical protein BDN72DRAFT_757785 [Pluteus cervinus]